MSSKKKSEDHFQTFRLFGKKAQEFLASAKSKTRNSSSCNVTKEKENNSSDEELTIHLSTGSVAKATFTILGILLLAFFLYKIRQVLLILFLAMFLAIVIDPGVHFMERMRLPRGFAIFIVYIFALAMLLFLIFSFIPILAIQIQQMAENMSNMIDRFLADPTFSIPLLGEQLNRYFNVMLQQFLADFYTGGLLQNMEQFGEQLSNAAKGSLAYVVNFAGSVVAFVVKFVLVLVLCFFMQLEKERIFKWARVFLPYRLRRYADSKAEAIHAKLAQWIRGQLMLSLSIGILVFLALKILDMDYALTLAVLAFFAEFVPVVGPIIAAIPAVFIALAQSGIISAGLLALVYYGIQWCENNLLVPLIMQRAVGLSPIAVMTAMLIGVSFPEVIHPVLGILLAVPMATIISLFIQDYREWRGINDH